MHINPGLDNNCTLMIWFDWLAGTFECQQVWETHFPLHPRLKTGPGKLGTSKGVQQLRFILNAFSVNNRNNMFVYQEDSGNVFYLRLHESSCSNHKNSAGTHITSFFFRAFFFFSLQYHQLIGSLVKRISRVFGSINWTQWNFISPLDH